MASERDSSRAVSRSVNSRYSEIDNDPTKALAGVRHGERD
jgi:hypothetical protein